MQAFVMVQQDWAEKNLSTVITVVCVRMACLESICSLFAILGNIVYEPDTGGGGGNPSLVDQGFCMDKHVLPLIAVTSSHPLHRLVRVSIVDSSPSQQQRHGGIHDFRICVKITFALFFYFCLQPMGHLSCRDLIGLILRQSGTGKAPFEIGLHR